MYVIVRKDLSLEQQSVQAIHASIETARLLGNDKEEKWEHPHLVLCGVENENALKNTIQRLVKNNIPFSYFVEPDLNNEITAIATFPLRGEKRDVMSRYQLLSFDKSFIHLKGDNV